MACEAEKYLTADDWDVVFFYQRVADQIVVIREGEEPWYAPRIEGWLAVAEVYVIPADARPTLFEDARLLHEAVHGRLKLPEAFSVPSAELAPVEVPADE